MLFPSCFSPTSISLSLVISLKKNSLLYFFSSLCFGSWSHLLFSRVLIYAVFSFSNNTDYWTSYWHYKYGNCFVFNSGKNLFNQKKSTLKSNKPGPSHGAFFWFLILTEMLFTRNSFKQFCKKFNSSKLNQKDTDTDRIYYINLLSNSLSNVQ